MKQRLLDIAHCFKLSEGFLVSSISDESVTPCTLANPHLNQLGVSGDSIFQLEFADPVKVTSGFINRFDKLLNGELTDMGNMFSRH